MTPEELEKITERFTLAGRLMAVRDFGKGAFISIQDRKGRLQAFLRKNQLGEKTFSLFKRLDIGDIVWIAGRVFKTRTGELTIDVEENGLRLLSKSLRPLPEKWHGLTDVEIRYRQRHLDLIVNPEVRKVFHQRSRIISLIRRFMEERDFLEVETPMMQPRAGGAVARPFKTFHNALGMNLFLRIAPELYLKRLITGGLERVFEINRNFRNEGISTFHNPEFTMMEFYQAYATYEDLMAMTEELFVFIVRELFDSPRFSYQGKEIDLTPPWRRLTVRDAVVEIGGVEAGRPRRRRPNGRPCPEARNRGEGERPARQGADGDLRRNGGEEPHSADLRHPLPRRRLAPLPPERRGPLADRPLRALHLREGDRERLLRTERPRRPAREVRDAAQGKGGRRSGGP